MPRKSHGKPGPHSRYPIQEYLGLRDGQPPAERLDELARLIKPQAGKANRQNWLIYASVLLEHALHPDTSEARAEADLDRATDRLDKIVNLSPAQLPAQRVTAWCNALLHTAFLPIYSRVSRKEPPQLDDISQTYDNLHDRVKEVNHVIDSLDGTEEYDYERRLTSAQLRFGLHIVNARFNMRQGEVLQHSWPTMPRQALRIPGIDTNVHWSMGVSKDAFWSPDAWRIKPLAGRQKDPFHPSVTVISSIVDLQLPHASHIVLASLAERDEAAPPGITQAATATLDAVEQRFNGILGWNHDS